MDTVKKDQRGDKVLLLFGCIFYLIVIILWIEGMADITFVIFGGISSLLTILSSYELKANRMD